MKFAIVKQHLDFFYQRHYIEFENLLTPNEVESLTDGIKTVLANRLSTQPGKLSYQKLKTLYLNGFDTWRESDLVKKIALRPLFAEVASNLVKKKPLRIGFDQAFCTPSIEEDLEANMPPLFKHDTTICQTSCLQGISCGLILHLSAPAVPAHLSELSIENDVKALIPIPRQAGSGIFFSPDMPLSLEHLMVMPGALQLLIVYTEDKTFYRLNNADPQTHLYKKMGYVFGDKLKNTTHPLIYRG